MKKTAYLIRFQLKRNKRPAIIWSLVMFGLMAMYMAFFSTMQEVAQVKFEMLPNEYLQLIGAEDLSAMGNYVSFFGMIFNILIIAASVYAITSGISTILKEERSGTIEFLYALPVTRTQILISKITASFLCLLAAVLSAAAGGILFGFFVGGETFQIRDMLSIILITGLVPFVFLAAGVFMASCFPSVTSSGLGCGIVMISYMLGYLARILETEAEFLKYFSPFELLSPSRAVFPSNTLPAFAAYAVLTVILLSISFISYRRRDFRM